MSAHRSAHGSAGPALPHPLHDRRLAKWIIVSPNGCWIWGGKLRYGYGQVSVGRRHEGKKRAHRWAYELLHGPIPDGLTLDHLCRVRSCVNPAHLEPVSVRENTLRGEGITAKNSRMVACALGHPFVWTGTQRKCAECHRQRERDRRRRQRGAA